MPRGPVGGATAALISALADQGVRVSAYQIERWRTTGELPRPRRRGLGRGRGVASEAPDDLTIQTALRLAQASRRGSPRPGGHIVERFAVGLPVDERAVRRAFAVQLDQLARMSAADVTDEDAGWQARQDIAARATREVTTPVGWQGLIDAAAGAPEQPDPPRARTRAAITGLIHAVGGGSETVDDDLLDLVGLTGQLTAEEHEALRRAHLTAELEGTDRCGAIADLLSVRHLRGVLARSSMDQLQRAVSAVSTVAMVHGMVMMLGLVDVLGVDVVLDERLRRFDASMVRRVQADPMWAQTSTQTPLLVLGGKPRQRIRQLVLSALVLLTMEGQLEVWEAYRDRLIDLVWPDP